MLKPLAKTLRHLSVVEAARRAPAAIRRLTDDLRIPSAADVGVRREDFPRLAKAASINVSVESNPRMASEQDFLDMYEAAQAVSDTASAHLGTSA